jgi:GNAT superfamily N-acetyltransferase
VQYGREILRCKYDGAIAPANRLLRDAPNPVSNAFAAVMKNIRLIQLDPDTEQKLANNPRYQAAIASEDWGQLAELVYSVVGKKLPTMPDADAPLHWGGYLVADAATCAVVGSCAFKGAPSADGQVEIAYFTYPGYEGRGYATAMAATLVALASAAREVSAVIAHTLPESNASTRILEKNGFQFACEITDPDDGQVWRWENTFIWPAPPVRRRNGW